MKALNYKFFLLEAQLFMDFVAIQEKPEITLVQRPELNLCVLNDYYPSSKALHLNTCFLDKCSETFALLIILHEIFHFAHQDLTDSKNVTKLRDANQWYFVQLLDVEADLRVGLYCKHRGLINSFDAYMAAFKEGAHIFRDEEMRHPKLERFIGSTVTIYAGLECEREIVFVPRISHNQIIVLMTDYVERHMRYVLIAPGVVDMERWSEIFQNGVNLSHDVYITIAHALSKQFYATLKK